MMSVNDLPDYHFKPLALTVDQIENPTSVILDFFSSFHLPDFREHFKKMFEDSLHRETVEPQMHHQTFIEVEKLVEACWVIREDIIENNGTGLGIISPVPKTILGKDAPAIEKVKTEPLNVIKGIFKNFQLNELKDIIRDWHLVASTSQYSVYDEDTMQRRQLFTLSEELYQFVEQLSIIHANNGKDVNQPIEILNFFFQKFPIVYLRRELRDWLDAGISYVGKWPVNFTERSVIDSYETLLCLIECARVLTLKHSYNEGRS